jgi:hypothetical protein
LSIYFDSLPQWSAKPGTQAVNQAATRDAIDQFDGVPWNVVGWGGVLLLTI